MLFAFGLADRIIAVGDYDDLPAGYKDKPRIGGLLNPNIEKIIEYKPDLVITYGSQESLEQLDEKQNGVDNQHTASDKTFVGKRDHL